MRIKSGGRVLTATRRGKREREKEIKGEEGVGTGEGLRERRRNACLHVFITRSMRSDKEITLPERERRKVTE